MTFAFSLRKHAKFPSPDSAESRIPTASGRGILLSVGLALLRCAQNPCPLGLQLFFQAKAHLVMN